MATSTSATTTPTITAGRRQIIAARRRLPPTAAASSAPSALRSRVAGADDCGAVAPEGEVAPPSDPVCVVTPCRSDSWRPTCRDFARRPCRTPPNLRCHDPRPHRTRPRIWRRRRFGSRRHPGSGSGYGCDCGCGSHPIHRTYPIHRTHRTHRTHGSTRSVGPTRSRGRVALRCRSAALARSTTRRRRRPRRLDGITHGPSSVGPLRPATGPSLSGITPRTTGPAAPSTDHRPARRPPTTTHHGIRSHRPGQARPPPAGRQAHPTVRPPATVGHRAATSTACPSAASR